MDEGAWSLERGEASPGERGRAGWRGVAESPLRDHVCTSVSYVDWDLRPARTHTDRVCPGFIKPCLQTPPSACSSPHLVAGPGPAAGSQRGFCSNCLKNHWRSCWLWPCAQRCDLSKSEFLGVRPGNLKVLVVFLADASRMLKLEKPHCFGITLIHGLGLWLRCERCPLEPCQFLLTGINCKAGTLFDFRCFYTTTTAPLGSTCPNVSETPRDPQMPFTVTGERLAVMLNITSVLSRFYYILPKVRKICNLKTDHMQQSTDRNIAPGFLIRPCQKS